MTFSTTLVSYESLFETKGRAAWSGYVPIDRHLPTQHTNTRTYNNDPTEIRIRDPSVSEIQDATAQ
jgi:hypothetical protein